MYLIDSMRAIWYTFNWKPRDLQNFTLSYTNVGGGQGKNSIYNVYLKNGLITLMYNEQIYFV